jgi:hypothetical protein
MRTIRIALLLGMVPASLAAQGRPMSPAHQIALAVLPLPMQFRANATVLGYDASGALVPLRRGTGEMICLATDPKLAQFHVACYHKSLEPFMLRGRQLRAGGMKKDEQVDSARFAEIKAGTLKMPSRGALWTLSGPMSAVDTSADTVGTAVRPLYVVYLPYATAATTGLPDTPIPGMPWLMDPGTAKAHIMIVPR